MAFSLNNTGDPASTTIAQNAVEPEFVAMGGRVFI